MRTSLMLPSKARNLQEGSKVGTRAPSRVTSPSSCYEMRNIQSVVNFFLFPDVIVPLSSSPVVQNVCVCVWVCRPVTAVSVGVRTQHPEADEGRDGGAAESPGHPQQSGKVESSFSLLVTESLGV